MRFFNWQVSVNAGRCLFFVTLILFSADHLQAAEPDNRLFSANADERFSAYQDKTQQLAEALAAATDEKNKEQLILQQELLAKLKEFPDKAEKPMLDFGLPDLPGGSLLTWQHFDLFLQRYADVMKQSKKSAANIAITTQQIDELYNKLLALDEGHPDKSILQLQHAIQRRKLEHQKEVDAHLGEGLARAKDEYSAILHSIVPLDSGRIAEQERAAAQAAKDLELLEEKTQVEITSTDVMIQKQESLLADFLGQELSDSAKKSMHLEQLNLLNLQVAQVVAQNQLLKGTLNLLIEQQNLIWFRLLSSTPEFFKLADKTGDVKNQLQSLREKIVKQQALTHTYEKDVSALGGGNAVLGPKAEELLLLLNQKMQGVFEQLSGLDQQGEAFENRGTLLERAINLKQSALGSVMTKTREATDTIYEKILSVLKYPLLSYSGMSISLLLMVQLLFLLAVGIIINRIYCHSIIRIGEIRKWTERTVHLVQAVGKYPFLFMVAMIILSVVGINTSSLALVAGALSVGVGFGMQTIVNNLVSGIILLFDKSISPGDFISLGDWSAERRNEGKCCADEHQSDSITHERQYKRHYPEC